MPVREIPNHLGEIIKKSREKSGITIEALANKLEITERYLYRIENEGKKPSFDVLEGVKNFVSL